MPPHPLPYWHERLAGQGEPKGGSVGGHVGGVVHGPIASCQLPFLQKPKSLPPHVLVHVHCMLPGGQGLPELGSVGGQTGQLPRPIFQLPPAQMPMSVPPQDDVHVHCCPCTAHEEPNGGSMGGHGGGGAHGPIVSCQLPEGHLP
jgi:hypothetical protein